MSEPDKPTVGGYAVFCGLDVGKGEHHACALDPSGRKLHDKALSNDEAALREVFTRLSAHGSVLVIVDQPASIGAGHRGRPIAGHRGRLPTGPGDAPHRRPAPR